MRLIRYIKPSSPIGVAGWAAWWGSLATAAAVLSHAFPSPMNEVSVRSFGMSGLGLSTTVVAIAIPTALNLLSRLYEKYGSSGLRDALAGGLPLVRLALLAFSNILLLLLLVSGVLSPPAFWGWLAILSSLATVAVFFLFMDTVVDFVINEPLSAISVMGRRVEREFAGDGPRVYPGSQEYVTAIESAGDILAYAAGNMVQDATVDACLAVLDTPISKLLDLKGHDASGYYAATVTPGLLAGRERDLASALAFFPDATLAGLMLPIGQGVRGFLLACSAGNDEAGRKILSWIVATIVRLSGEPGNGAEIMALLRQFPAMTEAALSSRSSSLAAYVSHGWFFAVTFPGPSESRKPPRDEYLHPLAETAFGGMRHVVRDAPLEVFKSFCAYAADWKFEPDVGAAGGERLELADEMAFSVVAYAVAAGKPEYVAELLEYGRRAAASSVGFGRETLPMTSAGLLSSWFGTWCESRRFGVFDGVAGSGAYHRERAFVMLLARSLSSDCVLLDPAQLSAYPEEGLASLAAAAADLLHGDSSLAAVSPDHVLAVSLLTGLAGCLEPYGRSSAIGTSPPSDGGGTGFLPDIAEQVARLSSRTPAADKPGVRPRAGIGILSWPPRLARIIGRRRGDR